MIVLTFWETALAAAISDLSHKVPSDLKFRRRKLAHDIADQIKRQILLGKFKAGTVLPPVKDLAARFGIGVASLREALRLLEEDGFILMKSGPHGGPIVTHPSDDEVSHLVAGLLQLSQTKLRDLHHARCFLELPIVRHAALHRTDDVLSQLESSITGTREATERVAFHRHAFDFHQIIVDSTENRILQLFFGCLRDLVYQSFVRADIDLTWQREKADEHGCVYQAIQEQDPDLAEHHLRAHLDGFEPLYSRYLDEQIERLF